MERLDGFFPPIKLLALKDEAIIMHLGTLHNIKQDEHDFISELQKFLESCVGEFSSALIGDLSHINSRAECHTDINIESLYKSGNGEYQLDYSYDWSVYNGCADMDESDQVEAVTFVYVSDDGDVEIEILDVGERNTVDEF